MQTFYTRTLTALVFAAVMLGGILWNPLSFMLLFLLIGCGGVLEYFTLMKKIHPEYSRTPGYQQIIVLLGIPAGLLIASGHHVLWLGQPLFLYGLQLALFLLMLLLLLTGLGRQPGTAFRNLGYSLTGLLYVGLPVALMVHLMWQYPVHGLPLIPLAILLSLWINDTLAYIVGSLIGRTPFFPAISPKKTWEGTLGGIVLTLVAGGLYGYFSPYYTIGLWMALAGLTAITGTAGDLLESRLKRRAGVKDSGRLLPGHGGLLDRFDSLLLATPFVWLLFLLIG